MAAMRIFLAPGNCVKRPSWPAQRENSGRHVRLTAQCSQHGEGDEKERKDEGRRGGWRPIRSECNCARQAFEENRQRDESGAACLRVHAGLSARCPVHQSSERGNSGKRGIWRPR